MSYPNTHLFINGKWRPSHSGRTIDVLNPATEEVIGTVAHADKSDLDEALAAAAAGFKVWRATPPADRSKIMRKAAQLLRERIGRISNVLTMEQGKPLAEAKGEALGAADTIEWFAEEARRTLWPHHSLARCRNLSARHQGACRSGRRVHPVEFSDQPSGAQTLRGPCRRLLGHRKGTRRDPHRPPN